MASRACELGRITDNEIAAKASREVRVGNVLRIKSDAGEFEIEVLLLTEMRGPAAVAQTLYRETEASREAREKFIEERKAMRLFDPVPEARPSKRDRRDMEKFRGY